MITSDAAFLTEVEDFLTSCDLPTPPVPIDGDINRDEASPTHAAPLPEQVAERFGRVAP